MKLTEQRIEQLFDEILLDASKKNYDYSVEDSVSYDYYKFLNQNDKALIKLRPPVHNKSILLCYAFNTALQNYQTIRIEEVPNNNTSANEKKFRKKQNIDVELFEFINNRDKEILKKQIKEGKGFVIKQFNQIEPLIWNMVSALRNYHSHFFHSASVLQFKNFATDINAHWKLDPMKWDTVKQWLQERINSAKEHITKQLNNALEKATLQEDRDAITTVLKRIHRISLLDSGGVITEDAQLFLACNFLRKSQAKFVVSKWSSVKLTEGYYKFVSDFFSYHSTRDRYSLSGEQLYIRNFRHIMSLLSSIPYSSHPQLSVVYKKINTINASLQDKIKFYTSVIKSCENSISNESLKPVKERNKKQIETWMQTKDNAKSLIADLKEQVMGVRKNENITDWMLRYLQDQDLLNDFKIACSKDSKDYANEMKFLLGGKTLSMYMFDRKQERNAEKKKKMLENIKAFKSNFIYKHPNDTNYKYCIKENSGLFQYVIKKHKDQNLNVQLTLSPALLTKWVFIDLIHHEQGLKVKDSIIDYINGYSQLISQQPLESFYGIENIQINGKKFRASQVLPYSIRHNYTNDEIYKLEDEVDLIAEVGDKITTRLTKIERFTNENNSQVSKFRFGAHQKITWIFDYLLFCLNETWHVEAGISSDIIRETIMKKSLNRKTYLDAFYYLRFFGRYYETDVFTEFFSQEYFQPISEAIKTSKSLEDLFQYCIDQYAERLIVIKDAKLNNQNCTAYAETFRVYKYSERSHIKREIEKNLCHNLCLGEHLITVSDFVSIDATQTPLSTNTKKTEFSDIRSILQQRNNEGSFKNHSQGFTNIDYMLQNILPLVKEDQKDKETIESKDRITGNAINDLLTIKTDELLLWNIANYYWNKVYKVNLPIDSHGFSYPYYHRNIFNKIFKRNVIVTVVDKNGTAIIDKSKKVYKIEISTKKFDDEYHYDARTHFWLYAKFYYNEDKKHESREQRISRENQHEIIMDYNEIKKLINKRLQKYVDDMYLLLQTEKYLLSTNAVFKNNITDLHKDKDENEFNTFYLEFEKIAGLYQGIMDDYNATIPRERSIFRELNANDLKNFRNNTFHYQLHHKFPIYLSIKTMLMEYLEKIKKV